MASVTGRIKQIKQPYGGYLNKKIITTVVFDDRENLIDNENIHSSLVGLAVDYLTRCAMGTPVKDAFKIPLLGARNYDLIVNAGSDHPDEEITKAFELLKRVRRLDDEAIIIACKLSGYDVCYRSGIVGFKPIEQIVPDEATINAIKIMVNRCCAFWEKYGPIVKDGFTLEGGYTELVSTGDGDYLTQDAIWDLKVIKGEPTSKHTLQLLMYYIMGCHSVHPEFKSIKRLGIFNPRKNKAYIIEISSIPQAIIDEVSSTVIGYNC